MPSSAAVPSDSNVCAQATWREILVQHNLEVDEACAEVIDLVAARSSSAASLMVGKRVGMTGREDRGK